MSKIFFPPITKKLASLILIENCVLIMYHQDLKEKNRLLKGPRYLCNKSKNLISYSDWTSDWSNKGCGGINKHSINNQNILK